MEHTSRGSGIQPKENPLSIICIIAAAIALAVAVAAIRSVLGAL